VDVFVEWQSQGKIIHVDAAEFLVADGKTLSLGEWVYTGSRFTPDGQFLAQRDGTLIGFVHDPASIIEHRSGFLGAFESLGANPSLLPKVGTRVKLIVTRKNSHSGAKKAD
jgi:hypothetical protein